MVSSAPPPPPALRILCLHPVGSNATHFRQQLDRLGQRLWERHRIDLLYVNAPLLVPDDDEVDGADQRRVWWWPSTNRSLLEEDDARRRRRPLQDIEASSSSDGRLGTVATSEPKDKQPTPPEESAVAELDLDSLDDHEDETPDPDSFFDQIAKSPRSKLPQQPTTIYTGLDASLLLIQQVWASMPMDGILGVGAQGAALAGLATLMLQPSLSISWNAASDSLLETDERLLDDRVDCLHLVPSLPSAPTLLQRQLGGTIVPASTTREALNLIGRFLVQSKLHAHQEPSSSTSRRLQTALARAEDDATQLLWRRLQEPGGAPAKLMAVITPSGDKLGPSYRTHVGGGGGAPCPSDFVKSTRERLEETTATT